MLLMPVLRASRRRLPSRVVIAWAVLGAAIAISVMFSRGVYSGTAQDHHYFPWNFIDFEAATHEERRQMMRPPDSSGTVKVLGVVAYDGRGPKGEAHRTVDQWHAGVALALGLMGAAGGVTASRARRRRRRAAPNGDGRLWLICSTLLFVLLVRTGVPGEGWNLWQWLRDEYEIARHAGLQLGPNTLRFYGRNATRLAVISLTVGWATHVVLMTWGIRLPRRAAPEQAADYADHGRPTPGA